MRPLRSPLIVALCLVVLVSLLSGLVVSAAPEVSASSVPVNVRVLCKPAGHTPDSTGKNVILEPINCCAYGKVSATTVVDGKVEPLEAGVDPCCLPLKLNKPGALASLFIPNPCEEPTPAPTCGVAYTADAVVGDLPFDTQAYWSPGKPAAKVIVNAGTYWVLGIGTDAEGADYYQIIVACQTLFVPVEAMQPSYQPPWQGQPLPTTPVE